MVNQDEMRRLLHGPAADERIPAWELSRLCVHCPGNAPEVLARCREALAVVLREDPERLPDGHHLRKTLPAWLVAVFREELTDEEEDKLMKLARICWPWTAGTWTSWFEMEERDWYWWDARVASPDLLVVDLWVERGMFRGALDFLLRSAGATRVELVGHQ